MVFKFVQKNGEHVFRLLSGQQLTIGRKGVNIFLLGDESISRSHALIKADGEYLSVTDSGSKYKTFYKNKAIIPNVKTLIRLGEEITFGIGKHTYIVEKEEIITCASGMTAAEKAVFSKTISTLGGTIRSEWDSTCTHLTMPTAVLSVKTLSALIDNKLIVTINYWLDCIQNIELFKPLPNIEQYVPKSGEILLPKLQLLKNNERKKLFRGKMFVFVNERLYYRTEKLIERAGGMATTWKKEPIRLAQVKQCKDYIFIQPGNEDEVPTDLQEIYNYLEKNQQRLIAYQEIGGAIVSCSMARDCNPHFNRIDNVFQQQSKCFMESALAVNTMEQDTDMVDIKPEIIISSSLKDEVISTSCMLSEPNLSRPSISKTPLLSESSASIKRALSEILTPAKKIKYDFGLSKAPVESSIYKAENRGTKRKADFNENITLPMKQAENIKNKLTTLKLTSLTQNEIKLERQKLDEYSFKSKNSSIISKASTDFGVALSTAVKSTIGLQCKKVDQKEDYARGYVFPKENVLFVVKIIPKISLNSSLPIMGGKKNFKKFVKIPPKFKLDTSMSLPKIIRISSNNVGETHIKQNSIEVISNSESSDEDDSVQITEETSTNKVLFEKKIVGNSVKSNTRFTFKF